MKTLISILSFVCISIIGCTTPSPESHYVTVMVDITGDKVMKYDPMNIITLLKTYPLTDGIHLRLIPISDSKYAIIQEFVLPKGEVGLLANEDIRRKQRKKLFQQFTDSLQSLQSSHNQELTQSQIFTVIVEQLILLSKEKNENKKLIVVSNLEEHSRLFSVHNASQKQVLLQNPQSVAELFKKQVEIPNNLQGIKLEIVHTPSIESEEMFSRWLEVYKIIFESKGIQVTVNRPKIIEIK